MSNQIDIDKFNSLIDIATKAVACDANCQREKTETILKHKYLYAKDNLSNADPKFELAKKNYFTFVSGEDGYNIMMEKEFNNSANKIVKMYKDLYDEETSKLDTQINTYDSILLNYNNVVDLLKKYKRENLILFKQLKEDANDVLTNERKTYYENQEIDNLNGYYTYFFLTIYVVIVFCFIVFSLIYPSRFSFIARILLTIFFVILPFISSKILAKIIQIIYWIFNLLPKNVYKKM